MKPPSGWRCWPLATVLLLAWLGGGLLSATVAASVGGQNDQLYAALNIVGALLALLLLTAAGPRVRLRRSARSLHRPPPVSEGTTSSTAARVPTLSTSSADDRLSTGRVIEPAANGQEVAVTRQAPPPREPTDTPCSTLPMWAPEHWPGAPQPVVVLAEDSLAALAAARWAALSASHHRTDVALVVLVPASSGQDCPTHLDDARATAARLLPTTQRYGVRSHTVVVLVEPKATASAATRVRTRAVADVAATLDTPLLVLAESPDPAWTRRIRATVPRDVLVVPAPEVHTLSPART